MRHLRNAAGFLLALFALATVVFGQSQPQEAKEPTGSITGRIAVGGKPAQGVIVMLTRRDADAMKTMAGLFGPKSTSKASTDEEGRYRFTNVAAGRYSINPFAPVFVIPSEPGGNSLEGRVIKVEEGEAVEKVDFAMTRGGVVTGRITDAQGRPVVGQAVRLESAEDGDKQTQISDPLAGTGLGNPMFKTDDRGIFRLYGLPAGRYVLSIGAPNQSAIQLNLKRSYYAQTFHPGVTDKAKAAIIEVKEGSEATGIDIKLGLPSQTYKASGRIVDAATGKPVANAVANFGAVADETKMVIPRGLGSIANSKGEFQLDQIAAGRYYAFASFDEGNDSYSDSTPFEISSGDVTGLVIKAHRGLTVSGIVAIEGAANPETVASLTQLQLSGYITGQDATAPRDLTAKIAPDGAFRMTGAQPGTLHIYINRFFVPTKLSVLRLERNGVRQQGGLQINAGESLSDVRVILANANGTLRGQIKLAGDGSLEDASFEVMAHRAGDDRPMSYETTEVDASGRFVFEGLLPGEYELTVKASKIADAQGKDSAAEVKQSVQVTNESEANVTVIIDPGAKKDKKQ
jgi:hypothetical protein